MGTSWATEYRPRKYKDLVGNTLQGKILQNSVVQGDPIKAAFLAGTRGSGKTSLGRIYARHLQCLNPTEDNEPCGVCDNCREIMEGRFADVIEIDAASQNSVQGIRELIKTINYLPASGKYKVVILDEVHSLSVAASNALLKTMEEPPEHVIFVLCTTEPLKVLDTIRSRCLMFTFKDISSKDIVKRLSYIADKEGANIDELALNFIAKHANGGLRDSVMLLQQAVLTKPEGELIKSSDIMDLVGFVSILDIQQLFVILKQGTLDDLLKWLDEKTFAPIDIMTSAINFLETIIFIKQGVSPASFVAKDLVTGIMSLSSLVTFSDVILLFKEFTQIIYDLRNLSLVNTQTLFRLKMCQVFESLSANVLKQEAQVERSQITPMEQPFIQMLKAEFDLVRIPLPI